MRAFTYGAASAIPDAIAAHRATTGSRYVAGGTCLIDLMKLDVETPPQLVDVNRLPLADIAETAAGGVRLGALARNSTVAQHPLIRERYPLLSEALLAGASAQLRNMATVGGNLMQRTRCTYFRAVDQACNKRTPGAGCGAAEGFHRGHAILGTSERCFATHPSDMCVALLCLDAVVDTEGGSQGPRRIPLDRFHRPPADTPHIETVLDEGELIVAVEIPPPAAAWRSRYVKVRDRASYEFALVSVAALVAVTDGIITDVRLGFGGVATTPWRATAVEERLRGGRAEAAAFRAAADAAVADAAPRRDNRFKVELLKRTLMRTLADVTGVEP
jgi:xanthine dehydrogenase YagS FAD-binding subunit